MSEIAVAQMRSRMLKETEGFLSQRLTFSPGQTRSAKEEFVEYLRRFALRHGQLVDNHMLQELAAA